MNLRIRRNGEGARSDMRKNRLLGDLAGQTSYDGDFEETE